MAATRRALLVTLLALGHAACTPPDPKAELELLDLETYWVIDSVVGPTRYISPAVRFRVRNRTDQPRGTIQAQATFRRKGEEAQEWGGDWKQVATAGQPLGPGRDTLVVLKSDGRYYSTGSPESMFEHKLFKDAKVDVFLRVGSSGWVRFAGAEIERRVGAKSVPADVRE